jgi:TetR/AcrR family transcriptional repressor of nem operon
VTITVSGAASSLSPVGSTDGAALLQAKSRSEFARNADLDALARFLTSSLQGLRLVGKANPDRATLEDISAMILRYLDT